MELYAKMMKMDETERQLLEKWQSLPPEVIPLLLKMLDDYGDGFEEAEKELMAYVNARRNSTT